VIRVALPSSICSENFVTLVVTVFVEILLTRKQTKTRYLKQIPAAYHRDWCAHLREAEGGAEDPRHQQHQTNSAWSSVLTDWIDDRHTPVDTDDDDYVRRQVQTEHLQYTIITLYIHLTSTANHAPRCGFWANSMPSLHTTSFMSLSKRKG